MVQRDLPVKLSVKFLKRSRPCRNMHPVFKQRPDGLPHWLKSDGNDACNCRDNGKLSKASLPEAFRSDRSFSTCIYYLLTLGQVSWFHRLISSEVSQFQEKELA